MIAFSGHQFHVIAMDGNAVPSPKSVDVLMLGPGERIDAYVEMNQPGVWILGSTDDMTRNAGMGVIVEYENQHSQPRWIPPAKPVWDYTAFGGAAVAAFVPLRITPVIWSSKKSPAARASSTFGR